MSFDDVRLSTDIEVGARGGLGFKTNIKELGSGHEKRNADWSQVRGEWDVGYGAQDIATLQAIRDFHLARQGKHRGFRFRDHFDYQGAMENLGVGDASETNFQLRRQYMSGPTTYNRTITRPVLGTVQMFLDGVEESSFTVNLSTGVVTFSSAPGNNVVVTATFDFDVPVRFDVDRIDMTMETLQTARSPVIPIVQLRE